jgi:glycosyltransferase involved in cell wall biosynthesis
MPMCVVIDGVPIRGMSLGIVVEHLLEGWCELSPDDEIHLVIGPDAELVLPASVQVHRVKIGRPQVLNRLYVQNVTVPRLCRELDADAMLGVIPATTISPLPCPRTMIAFDLRHELRPEQFTRKARLLRKVSYEVGYRQADGIACISERTRNDLFASHPWLRSHLVRVALLGADHVKGWSPMSSSEEYAIAFGQWGNKNVDLVLDAWTYLHLRGEALPLVLVGLSEASRVRVQAKVDRLGLGQVVTILPWLPTDAFRQRFASARLVVFPSDFEGFGLPAVEAMRLGIPVVISDDPALLEVTTGHATVMDGSGPEALARAVEVARRVSLEDLAKAKSHAEEFTWKRTAAQVRELLELCMAGRDHQP